MDDPWDVKSVRQTGDYISFLKINGVPLLPPVLSKECRKEMQYYKLLAKEVEKRISVLQPYVSDTELSYEDPNALALPDSEPPLENMSTDVNTSINVRINKVTTVVKQETDEAHPVTMAGTQNNTKVTVESTALEATKVIDTDVESSRLVMDISVRINQTNTSISPVPPIEKPKSDHCLPMEVEVPERDYNCVSVNKDLVTEADTCLAKIDNTSSDRTCYTDKGELTEPPCCSCEATQYSLSSKTFTGSLNDLYSESLKSPAKMTRQRSYTVLEPSPQLLAHLEVQSLNTGVEMNSISMSESMSNLSTPSKKRRSWDLESAKVKWSSMALELQQKNIAKPNVAVPRNHVTRPATKRPVSSHNRARSVAVERRRGSISNPNSPISEPVEKCNKYKPVRTISNRTITKEPCTPKTKKANPPPTSPPKMATIKSEVEDPATKVRELYDKIQQQQLVQMANLVEKQKREQLMLQQVFEEQNTLLFKQLKTICPKSPDEIKEAWGDKSYEADRGPVSLSQLINPNKSPNSTRPSSPTSTLANSQVLNVSLKKNRYNSSNQRATKPNGNGRNASSPKQHVPDGSRTRTHSPSEAPYNGKDKYRQLARKLSYESSVSTERECDVLLTDRTNDTMADLNVTFPSDSDTPRNGTPLRVATVPAPMRSTDSAIRHMEQTIKKSIKSCMRRSRTPQIPPTPKEREAATLIVACAKGYLVRRLLRSERVQAAVRTIRDALECALQLHRDRHIAGPDVDLHRRLIQQITAACYSLHDTFITSSPAERCAMIAADRARRRSLAARPPHGKHADVMSQSHCGAFPARPKRVPSALMTQSSYESHSSEKCGRSRYMPSPRRRPWR